VVQVAFRMDDEIEDDDPAVEIPRLEAEVERLARVAESCRKVILAGKVAIAAGALVLIVTLTGILRVDELVPLAAIAGILGGIAAAGSNSRTLREATDKIRDAEARRAELIGALPFSAVIEDTKH
jgi:hypothetical protein